MALANQEQIEALADKMSGCADSIHERLIDAIKNKEIDQDTARSIFQDEASLRQRANGLYIDAAICVVKGLEESQDSLIGVINTASEKIKTMNEIAAMIDLVADVLMLATAVYAAKPMPIMAALNEIKSDLEKLS